VKETEARLRDNLSDYDVVNKNSLDDLVLNI